MIWETVKQIPKGKVATYGDVAKLSGLPGQQRLVGYALHNLPVNSKIPWQRVVNAQGRISLPRGRRGYERQKKLLEKEGILFIDEAVDLDRYGLLQSLDRE
jgi:methylated-DNA-protein-cysteine methyltransferase related protein